MEKNQFEEFARMLQLFRKRAKLNQEKLAEKIGVNRNTVSFWERGYYQPETLRTMLDIAEALLLNEEDKRLLLEARYGTASILPLHNLPESNPHFTGREEVLSNLHRQLTISKQSTSMRVQGTISGLGGVGKTQVAVEYAYRFRDQYHDILWAQADTREALEASYLELAHSLRLRERAEKDQDKVTKAVKRWLGEHKDWLLILDNIEDLALVSEFIPAVHQGFVLLTTQQATTTPIAHAVMLKKLADEEGMLLLLKRAGLLARDASLETLETVSTERRKEALGIVHETAGLPLALDQAGAYIAENGCSLPDYGALFKQEQKALLERRGMVPTTHPKSVSVTFALAFDRVSHKSGAAIELLKLCTFFAPDIIPLELITRGTAHLGVPLEAVALHPRQLDEVLGVLRAYSLIQRDGENRMLSIHRLVQAVLQDTLDEAERRIWAERAVLAVNAAFPKVEPETWPQCERLLIQALTVTQIIERDQIVRVEAGRLLTEVATYLEGRARYTEAEPLYQQALLVRGKLLGSEHSDVATSLANLANLYTIRGKYEQAELLLQQALLIREQQLESLDMAVTLRNLATLYVTQGKYEQAEPLLQRTLQSFDRLLGPEGAELAAVFNNLAALYVYQGKYERAEPLFLNARAIWEKNSGPHHPYVAYACSNLGELYLETGNYEQAEALFQRAQQIWEHLQESQHIGMAYVLNGLGNLCRKLGEYEQAEPLFQQALQLFKQHLETEHTDVAEVLNGMANLYRDQGKYTNAEGLYMQAIQIREKAFGDEKPETAKIIYDLAQLREIQGDHKAASALYIHALTVFEQAFSMLHPKTAEMRKKLITLYHAMGQHKEAARLEAVQAEQETEKDHLGK